MVANNMSAFVDTIQKSDIKGLNLTVVSDMDTISTVFNDGNNFYQIDRKVNSTDGLEITESLIKQGELQLREGSIKEFVYVTDDNANYLNGFKQFVAKNPKIKDKLAVSGLVWKDGVSVKSETCTKANNGSSYMDLADSLPRKGLILDLCSENWNEMFVQLANKIVEELTENIFRIDHSVDPSSLKISLDGRELSDDEFSFSEADATLEIEKDLVENNVGAELKVSFVKN